MDPIAQELQLALSEHVDPAYRARVLSLYHAPPGHVLGVPLPVVRALARAHAPSPQASADAVLARATALCDTRVFELKIVAFAWAGRAVARMRPAHFAVLASWLDTTVEDWADGDDLCRHVIGPFLLRHPAFVDTVRDDWPGEANVWVRRGAAVSLVPGLRRGRLLPSALAVAERLAADEAVLVRKAVGWVLAEATKRHPDAVARWLEAEAAWMPAAVVRRAREALGRARPPGLRAE